ncbi:UNVERIFIED_CONTAM: hypothetical protein HHA_293200 [Hammondia hammondi]|eukprot:XP_008884703.1 hypothetical protein HHA_293200 [Hammondia hammondi]
MRNFGRALLVAGAVLFVAAAYSVIQARHALRHAGGHLDDFVLPVNVIFAAVTGAALCMVGGLKGAGGFKRIHVPEEIQCWDRLHERFNFRVYNTRAACLAALVQNFITPPPA